jgi:NADH-quinone oxidoreductase subunit J
MTAMFYIAAVVAVLSTLMVVTRRNLVHALLYLVISLFAVAVVFYTLGAPFVAALEVIVYAGAIMMLFLFAVMLLNVSAESPIRVRRAWLGPVLLVAVLLAEVIYGITRQSPALAGAEVGPQAVSEALYGPYVLGVELASMLLLAALIGARHVAARAGDEQEAAESMERARAKAEGRAAQPGQGLAVGPDLIAGPDVVSEEGDP